VARLEVEDLSVRFETEEGWLSAVEGLSVTVGEAECVALVGESGSGKSATLLALMGLHPSPPAHVSASRLTLDGEDLSGLSEREWRSVRGRRIAMVFQDPMTALNPFMTVGQQLLEVLRTHGRSTRREMRRAVSRGLDEVGLDQVESLFTRHPHELSGGQRQRVMIAMALLTEPAVLLADEPTTALDVTVQAQVLELLAELRERHGTAVLLVTHDLSVVAVSARRVGVMYAGRLVETGTTAELLRRPLHPYSRGLIESVPRLDQPLDHVLTPIPGHPPRAAERPAGCAFHPRCDLAGDRCRERMPLLERVLHGSEEPRRSACHESGRMAAESAR
jgi:oligopeptide/dipeptide ABC transporter ATP-binding protein